MIRTQFEIDGLIAKLNDIEKRSLPRALSLSMNDSAFQVRDEWKRVIPTIFDRPVPLTLNAVLINKGTPEKPEAEVFIRNEVFKGVPPAAYLAAEVFGGARRQKGSERLLHQFWVAGKGANLDAYGNVRGGTITAILSDIKAHPDKYSRTSLNSKKKRAKRGKRGGSYFIITKRRGRLRPGVYERIETGFGSAVKSVLFFVPKAPTYNKRFNVFKLAQDIFNEKFTDNFYRRLEGLIKA